MIELLGIAGRMAFLLGALGAVGSSLFLMLSGNAGGAAIRVWRQLWMRRIGVLPLLAIIGLVMQLVAQAMTLVGSDVRSALQPEILEPLLQRTNFGLVWTARSAAMLLFIMVWGLVHRKRHIQPGAFALMLIAAAAAMTGPWAGHSYGAEVPALMMSANALHLLAAGLWVGALPCWVSWAKLQVRENQSTGLRLAERFSRVAMISVVLLLLSGVLLADEFVEHLGDLLGTRYGLLISVKVVLFAGALWMANRVRQALFIHASGTRTSAAAFFRATLVSVRYETLLVIAVVMLAGALGQTTPAIHDQPVWIFPFRISWDAAWDAGPDAFYGAAGAFVAITAIFVGGMARVRSVTVAPAATATLSLLTLFGVSGAMYWLSVPAYPDTYRRSDVPYLAASVFQGQQLFQEHCISCHGDAGLGDGALASAMPVPPADLSEPHTALHTAGDMYWWFTHGIPESGMPGFAAELSEQDRWDLVNFLRAFSQGFEARVLRDTIIPRDPWLGAPNFYFRGAAGYSELKALRETSTVLLVFADHGNPQSRERLAALSSMQPVLHQAGLQILVVPIDRPISVEEFPGLQVVNTEAVSLWATYSLLSRSLADRGDIDALGVRRTHVEFLVDRLGYLRARWVPGESTGWNDFELLRLQVEALMQEPEIEPPPDDHVH